MKNMEGPLSEREKLVNYINQRIPEKPFGEYTDKEKKTAAFMFDHFDDKLPGGTGKGARREEGSKQKLYEDIDKALIDAGLDTNEISQLVQREQQINIDMFKVEEDDKLETMAEERDNVKAELNYKIKPVILLLIELGYTPKDLF